MTEGGSFAEVAGLPDGWVQVWLPGDPDVKADWHAVYAAIGAEAYLADRGRFERFRMRPDVQEELAKRYLVILQEMVGHVPRNIASLYARLTPIVPRMVFTKDSVRTTCVAGLGGSAGFPPPGPTDLEPLVRGLFPESYAVGPIGTFDVGGRPAAWATGTSQTPGDAPTRAAAVVVDPTDGMWHPVYVDGITPEEAHNAGQTLSGFLRVVQALLDQP